MMIVKNLQFILFNIVIQIQGLDIHPSIKYTNMLVTASAIRNTTNKLFLALKLKGIKKNPKIRQYTLIHNFFSTLASKDHDILNRIAIASRVDTNINNETRGFIDALNELVIEDSGVDNEEYNKDYLLEYVSQFISKLEFFKDVNGVNDNNFVINEQTKNMLWTQDHYNLNRSRESDENDSLISDNEFWEPESSGRRIFQGDNTKIKYFPFMASIQIFNRYQCGGCIIKSDLVITAASCLQLAWNNRFFRENPAFLSVRIGSNFYAGGGENVEVLEVYFHPQYNPKTLKNNVCLLRLWRRINFKKKGSRVKKIAFDRNEWNLPMTTDGITIVGWGAKGSANIMRDPWSNRLSYSVLDIYPNRECQDVYSRQYVTHKNFCAGFFSKGGGACNGDVGGPGIVGGILTGIVSFGSPTCGTPDAPTVFTKLGYYADWIENIMEQKIVHVMKGTTLRPTPPSLNLNQQNTLKPTTFKLSPIVGAWKPVSVNQGHTDALRILEDGDLFKEFLATMFGSKEAKEYEELVIDEATENRSKDNKRHKILQKKQLERPELQKHSIESVKHFTQNMKETTEEPSRFTLLDKNRIIENNGIDRESASDIGDDEEIESNILKLIENIDVNSDNKKANEVNLEKVIEENTNSESSTQEHKLENNESNILNDGNLENIDDSILTLLNFSDSDKKDIIGGSNVSEDSDENVSEGLSIAIDNFKDLTFRDTPRNDTGTFYDFLPKDEMYKLLAEAIDEVVNDNEKI